LEERLVAAAAIFKWSQAIVRLGLAVNADGDRKAVSFEKFTIGCGP
jgi:hypothetical protein